MTAFPLMPLHCRRSLLIALVLSASASASAFAQSNLRNTFPGNRMGGGTRGECSARLVTHLVPENSVYAPGKTGVVGILEGPTANPRPLQVLIQTSGKPASYKIRRDLPATGPGVTLLNIGSFQANQLWESSYRCEQSPSSEDGLGLDFVESASPPAKSLLVVDIQPADQQVAAVLQSLKASCGKTVETTVVVKAFGIEDAITPEWPRELPVRCL